MGHGRVILICHIAVPHAAVVGVEANGDAGAEQFRERMVLEIGHVFQQSIGNQVDFYNVRSCAGVAGEYRGRLKYLARVRFERLPVIMCRGCYDPDYPSLRREY